MQPGRYDIVPTIKETAMFKTFAACALITCAALLATGTFAAEQTSGRLAAAFKKADTDNDGTLTKQEAKSMPRVAKHFVAIDSDKDGTVSLAEIRASMHKAHERGVERFKAADKDNDGTLTREEAKSMPRVAKYFDAIDTDKDGTVSEQEIHDYMKARQPKK
jgi:Ca2+-binding EF-hand superfamily protein